MTIDLKKAVYAALDALMENGYVKIALHSSVDDCAIDLIDYDADIEMAGVAVMDVIPHVESWRARRA